MSTDETGLPQRRFRRTQIEPPPHLWKRLQPLARQMRREPTAAEYLLWQRLRRRQIQGVRFRRQVAIERFIVDFCSFQSSLIVEVDGPVHEYSQTEDAVRQAFLEFLGFRVRRFTNQQVFTELDAVVDAISSAISTPS